MWQYESGVHIARDAELYLFASSALAALELTEEDPPSDYDMAVYPFSLAVGRHSLTQYVDSKGCSTEPLLTNFMNWDYSRHVASFRYLLETLSDTVTCVARTCDMDVVMRYCLHLTCSRSVVALDEWQRNGLSSEPPALLRAVRDAFTDPAGSDLIEALRVHTGNAGSVMLFQLFAVVTYSIIGSYGVRTSRELSNAMVSRFPDYFITPAPDCTGTQIPALLDELTQIAKRTERPYVTTGG